MALEGLFYPVFPPKGIGVLKYSKSILFKVEIGISPTPNLNKVGCDMKILYTPPTTQHKFNVSPISAV